MDNNQKLDLDALFNGAGVVLNATQNTLGAVASGLNDVKTIMGDSRRNVSQPQMNGGYQQPVSYGYGYADTNPYPGYTSSSYGGHYNNGGGFFMNSNRANSYGGYAGFANPGYGSTAGAGGAPMNRPMGGAWL